MPLSEEQRYRYSRILALPEVGESGLEVLLDSHVAIVGTGGLGALLATELATNGIGALTLIDSDRVELSNLHRQLSYSTSDVGKRKNEALTSFIKERNPECHITLHNTRLEAHNAEELLRDADVIADGSDNFKTRFITNQTAFSLKTPLVSAAIIGWEGQLSTFKAFLRDEHPCYQCFCPEIPSEENRPNCSNNGVMGSVAATMASLQATEVIKELLNVGESLSGKLLRYDALRAHFSTSKLHKRQTCPVCN